MRDGVPSAGSARTSAEEMVDGAGAIGVEGLESTAAGAECVGSDGVDLETGETITRGAELCVGVHWTTCRAGSFAGDPPATAETFDGARSGVAAPAAAGSPIVAGTMPVNTISLTLRAFKTSLPRRPSSLRPTLAP